MKKRIALVTGGYSGEAAISYKSAVTVQNNIDTEKFEVYKIDINPQGWFFEDTNGNKTNVNRENFTITDDGNIVKFDAILFKAIHMIEDGKKQRNMQAPPQNSDLQKHDTAGRTDNNRRKE